MDLLHELKSSSIKDIGGANQLNPTKFEHNNQSQPLLSSTGLEGRASGDNRSRQLNQATGEKQTYVKG